MRKTFVALFLAGAAACAPDTTAESKKDLEGRADSVNDCCKIEGSEIGKEDHLVRLGTRYVLVHSWVPKAGSPGEYVGFSITASADAQLRYVVKAGTERHAATSSTWIHPGGVNGASAAPAISHVDFCPSCDDPDGCEDGGGDNGECDNPDGCGGGDGGGGGGGGDGGPILY